MSGSQHNPNGRQSQLGSGWNPMQMQMANLLARSQQLNPAHLSGERGHTWHTPTPPPHMYLPAPSPPDPLQGLQAMKSAGGNSVYRHTATPPDMYRHTPTPPEKHMMRGTPSPGDVKGPPVDIYQHLGANRETRLRADDILSFARQGSLDLSLGSRANGSTPPAPHPASPALSVRDAPTINSLIARAAPRRVDSLLERLVPSPHSVIVHSRAANTPSPPSSNEDSADSCGAPPGSKRKRKPERTVRLPTALPLAPPAPAPLAPGPIAPAPLAPAPPAHVLPPSLCPATLAPPPAALTPERSPAAGEIANNLKRLKTDRHIGHYGTIENGDTAHAKLNGPEKAPTPPPVAPPAAPAPVAHPSPVAHTSPRPQSPRPDKSPRINEETSRRKTRSGSAETIADIAAMIAGGASLPPPPAPPSTPALSMDKLQSVLGSPEPAPEPEHKQPEEETQPERTTPVSAVGALAPRRRAGSLSEATNAPVASPSEAKSAEPDAQPTEPAAASFVEVENQLEKMFAGIEEPQEMDPAKDPAPASKRRKSTATRGRTEAQTRRKGPRKKPDAKLRKPKEAVTTKEAKEYDSGSNASSGKSRGPYIQIRGGRADGSPVSVCVMNATTGEEEEWPRRRDARGETRRRGLHASTLGLRYDAATRDLTWLCAFCARPPHANGLGDLFGPYPVDTDIDEYRALDEATRRRATCLSGTGPRPEAWLHAECGVWAPGVLACGARLWGLARAVWSAAPARCRHCPSAAAPLACSARACPARAHLPCAREHGWRLSEEDFRALCPAHSEPHRPDQ